MAKAQEIGWSIDDEKELWRSICAPHSWHLDDGQTRGTHPRSLWFFVTKVWGAESFLRTHPAEPQWIHEPIHVPYCAWLQRHILEWRRLSLTGRPGRYHIASVLPRGYGKTVTSTKCATLWSGLDDPDMTILLQSATDGLSKDILKSQKAVISGEDTDSWFVWLYGNWQEGAKEWTKEYIKHGYRRSGNVSEPSIDTTSAGAGATGYHPRQNWWDDPLEKNKLKQDKTAYLRGQHDAVNASYNSLHVNGLMALTLTRYLDNDIAGFHFREEGIASWSGMDCPHMSLFDKVPFGEGLWHVFFYQTEDELSGEPTNPNLWTKKMIAQAKTRDAEDFACQQQNNPGSGEHAPLVEAQIPWLYLSYQDFLWDIATPQWATVHIDTAFKNKENIGQGDDSAIVVWIKGQRNDGILYLDTDLLRASNEWREEDFNKELIKVCLNLRKRGIFIRAITDEKEPGGKEGTYKNRILGILRTAGFNFGEDQFIQFNRTTEKGARIRTAAGHWAEGYVRIVLHRDKCDCPPLEYDPIKNKYKPRQCPHYIVPPVVKKLINQIVKVDTVQHNDLADAATDGFSRQLWMPPDMAPNSPSDEGTAPRRPWDDDLKDVGKPISHAELLQLYADREELDQQGYTAPGRGWGDDDWLPPREPV